eukprot:6200145-Pleurochrysis_carterae.AAC.2
MAHRPWHLTQSPQRRARVSPQKTARDQGAGDDHTAKEWCSPGMFCGALRGALTGAVSMKSALRSEVSCQQLHANYCRPPYIKCLMTESFVTAHLKFLNRSFPTVCYTFDFTLYTLNRSSINPNALDEPWIWRSARQSAALSSVAPRRASIKGLGLVYEYQIVH